MLTLPTGRADVKVEVPRRRVSFVNYPASIQIARPRIQNDLNIVDVVVCANGNMIFGYHATVEDTEDFDVLKGIMDLLPLLPMTGSQGREPCQEYPVAPLDLS